MKKLLLISTLLISFNVTFACKVDSLPKTVFTSSFVSAHTLYKKYQPYQLKKKENWRTLGLWPVVALSFIGSGVCAYEAYHSGNKGFFGGLSIGCFLTGTGVIIFSH